VSAELARVFDTRWFKTVIADKNLRQKDIAKQLQLDASAVSLMLRGKRDIKLEEAGELARILGVSVQEILDHAGVDLPPDYVGVESVPVIGWIDDAGCLHEGKGLLGPKRAVAPPQCVQGTVAARFQLSGAVGGFSMRDGWLIYWLPVEYVQPEAIGRKAVVTTRRDQTQRVRLIKPGFDQGQYRLLRPGDGQAESGKLLTASVITWMKQ